MGYGVIGNTADSGSAILGSSPGTPAQTRLTCTNRAQISAGHLYRSPRLVGIPGQNETSTLGEYSCREISGNPASHGCRLLVLDVGHQFFELCNLYLLRR
jgi:hypothetical protein